MTALVLLSLTLPQVSLAGAPIGDSPADLLHRADVQNELKMTPRQLKDWAEFDRLPKLKRGGTFEDDPLVLLDPDEVEKKNLKRENRAWSVLGPGQALRLRELTIQRAGIKALLRQDVQAELEFSNDQIESVARARARHTFAIRQLIKKMSTMKLDQKKVRDLLRTVDQQLVDDLTVVPDSGQNTKLEQMAGQKFKFLERDFGG